MALRIIKKLLFASASMLCIIYIGRIVMPACFESQVVQKKASSVKTRSEKRSASEIDMLWPMLGGLRDARHNTIEIIRQFFIDRPSKKWKLILRIGEINFKALKWSDGGEHLREIDCPVTQCYFTSNLSAVDSADALVISNYGKGHQKILTPKRKNQVWIAQILEPPMMVKIHSNLVNGLVNWTATYRRDSTITIPYGLWTKLDSDTQSIPSKKNYALGKTKKVAMFASNCRAISGRVEYAIELNKSIPVDIFGKCGYLNCSKYHECFDMLKKDYKFYLSFENSNCVGYMTEKFHLNALNNDVVPIVMGARRDDYAAAAPPHSFIHVDDFQSPSYLGKYLNLLDSNDALYNEYFHYKGRYRLHMYWTLGSVYWCQLCTRLHMMEYENLTHWYDDFNEWWIEACAPKYDKNRWKTWDEKSK